MESLHLMIRSALNSANVRRIPSAPNFCQEKRKNPNQSTSSPPLSSLFSPSRSSTSFFFFSFFFLPRSAFFSMEQASFVPHFQPAQALTQICSFQLTSSTYSPKLKRTNIASISSRQTFLSPLSQGTSSSDDSKTAQLSQCLLSLSTDSIPSEIQ